MTFTASVQSVAAILLAGAASAQTVPAGWKVVTDRQKLCQVAVPADWTPDSLVKSFVVSPDKKSTVVVHGLAAGTDYKTMTDTSKKLMPPVKIFAETATKLWYEEPPTPGKNRTSWYFAIGGAQVCNAEVQFEGAGMEDTAKKIVASLGPAAK